MPPISAEEELSDTPGLVSTPVSSPPSPTKGTYGQILKSSAIIGGSSVLNIAVGIVRTKIMALLLGPAGFGMLSLYGSIATLTQTLAGMGINSSGVRQIAEAAGLDDEDHMRQTTLVLRRISILLGLLGASCLIVFSRPISRLTFGTNQHAAQVSALSLAVFFALVSAGQGALIQGMRRIADLAKMGVLGALFGTIISIPLVYFFRDRGVVPSLIAVAAVTCLVSWRYSRKVHVPNIFIRPSVVMREATSLLKLGFAFMASGLMTVGVAYVIRITVSRRLGLEATGLYQAAWTLGGLYVGFILQAMGADFYPRLTAYARDHPVCNRLVNEQAHVGLLLGGPGVLATLTFAPLVIALFYSARFGAAVGVLRWICLGTIVQVVTWPMGFIIIAKAKQTLFIACELAWTIVSLALVWICISRFGLNGVGIAFFGSYIFHGFLIYGVVRKMSGFLWSAENKHTGALFLIVIAAVFSGFYILPFALAEGLGAIVTLLSAIYSTRLLAKLVSSDSIPKQLRRLIISRGTPLRKTFP
ncbi:O-antigen translocase [Edaphobacter paludis]|uniref:O-antigen translocase n=1 Tax=Edaphobacter paludis TaxID=3035702 RepID=A0AAU7CVF7_9BACT